MKSDPGRRSQQGAAEVARQNLRKHSRHKRRAMGFVERVFAVNLHASAMSLECVWASSSFFTRPLSPDKGLSSVPGFASVGLMVRHCDHAGLVLIRARHFRLFSFRGGGMAHTQREAHTPGLNASQLDGHRAAIHTLARARHRANTRRLIGLCATLPAIERTWHRL